MPLPNAKNKIASKTITIKAISTPLPPPSSPVRTSRTSTGRGLFITVAINFSPPSKVRKFKFTDSHYNLNRFFRYVVSKKDPVFKGLFSRLFELKPVTLFL
jgi:hypothetical protein